MAPDKGTKSPLGRSKSTRRSEEAGVTPRGRGGYAERFTRSHHLRQEFHRETGHWAMQDMDQIEVMHSVTKWSRSVYQPLFGKLKGNG